MHLHLATTGSRKVNLTRLNLGRLFFLFPLSKPVLACVVSVSALVFRLEKFGTRAKREMKGKGEREALRPLPSRSVLKFSLSLQRSRNNSIGLLRSLGGFLVLDSLFVPRGLQKVLKRGGSAGGPTPYPYFVKKGTPFVWLLLTNQMVLLSDT